MTMLIPAVLSTKQCHDYVGGSRIWEELTKHHSDILLPFRQLPRGDSHYLRSVVDQALMIAQAKGTLVNPVETKPPVAERKDRRFPKVKAAATP